MPVSYRLDEFGRRVDEREADEAKARRAAEALDRVVQAERAKEN